MGLNQTCHTTNIIQENTMIDNNYAWYPVYTRSKAEKAAFSALKRKNITAYLPLKKELKQWSDRKKIIEVPLLQSYLFTYISMKEYAEVLMTKGIARFIYFSGNIARIPEKQLEDLRLLLTDGSDLEIYNEHIAPGEKVLIRAGPFKGILAELVSVRNQKNIVLRLEQIGCSIQIKTSMSFIELIR
jgi:transcriptional antiterminator RfaH